ncbi:alternative ribosome rescue aminoacyl-tRNA hydrolase ArfB [Salaquimonas pukyongi]|uniref:alternative ribosome rescue aminoacyl-tRNA hydrolase ArfB n=1 Tax=Salaquimonas pukyongi TaxID=2712698 RepID=UPI00096BB14B|nr:alternative ribosome rescue aminoacyl-tRNA hydrolase ArfB [Salaquimonas pukyongi]
MGIPESELAEKFIHAAGPGGQNVNKVATAVQLRFDVRNSPSLTAYVKNRLRQIASHLMTGEGELVIEASRYRTQGRNREDARARLAELIAEAARPPPKKRRKTKPSKGAIERRLKAKAGRGQVKKLRGRVRRED